MQKLGIIVPAEIIEKFKQDSRFKKGGRPVNKGKKWNEFMSEAGQQNSRKTCFKKGIITHNKKPVGSIRITKDGYMEVKTREPNKWEAYHRMMWEETFGEIPKGHIVRFVTKDKSNVNPFNLELVSRAQNARLNANREKASDSLRKTWAAVKAMEDYGIKPATIKFRSKRKKVA